MTEQTNAVNDLLTNETIKQVTRRQADLYKNPDNVNRLSWFTESFIGACLLHPQDKATVMALVTKFNQRLSQPLTQSEQQSVYRRLRDELSTN